MRIEVAKMTRIEEVISQEKENLNIHEYAFLKSTAVIFSDEVRRLCEKNVCGMYGSSWACPPAVGSVEECKNRCTDFENAFMFTSLAKLKKKYDIAGWSEARKLHEAITEQVAQIFRNQFKETLILSAEGCTLCDKCTYPENPCRFPNRMFPATEGFGIMVVQQAPLCNIKYNNGENTITYFSIIFF